MEAWGAVKRNVDDDVLTLVIAYEKQCPIVKNNEFYEVTCDTQRSNRK